MNLMLEKIAGVWPEIVLGIGACLCLLIGLAREASIRKSCAVVAALTILASGVVTLWPLPRAQAGGVELSFVPFVKLLVLGVGLLLLLLASSLPGELRQTQWAERDDSRFDAGNVMRGEFFAFFLLSLAGVMLVAGADDLVWLFLALELVSLPTYVMVAASRDKLSANEAAVKYFFLGALAVAMFLYGFALIYGATGFTNLVQIRDAAATGVSPLLLTGLVLALLGMCFKIAAVPMHFYAADVYQGAASPVTAFLAFVPKTAGFIAILLLLQLLPDWPTHGPLFWLLWIVAALTMTVGNVLGLLQSSVKRVLAYSSIAHSGYMLVGLLAGPAALQSTTPVGADSGVAAVLFYLVAYGCATAGAFAVLACVRVNGQEADEYDDLAGLVRRQPMLAAVMLLCVLSLVGLPPLAGFIGKIYLFGSALSRSGEQPAMLYLVVLAVLNSAVSAVYYLRIVGVCFFAPAHEHAQAEATPTRRVAALLCALVALAIGVAGNRLVVAARSAAPQASPTVQAVERPTP